MKRLLASALIGYFSIAGLPAENPTPTEPLIKITVGLVQVDAVVTDKAGNAVRDLTAEDFRILQDGQERDITSFSFVDTSSRAGTGTKRGPGPRLLEADRARVRRTIAVVADDLAMSMHSINRVRKHLRKLVDEDKGDDDMMAIVRTSASNGFANGFTSDNRILHAALDELWWRPGSALGVNPTGLSVAAALGRPSLVSDPRTRRMTQPSAVSAPSQFFEERAMAGSLGALQHTIRGMRNMPGRKAVIFLSEAAFLFDPNRLEGSVGNNTFDRLDLFRVVVDEANRSGVVIYGLDPRGVGGDPLAILSSGRPDPRRRDPDVTRPTLEKTFTAAQDGLAFLARQTGGLFLQNSNDINGLVKETMADMSGYYLLGYAPDSETFNRDFHKIEVKLNRSDLRVRSRRGFFGYEDHERVSEPKTLEGQLIQALNSPFAANGLDIQMTALFAMDDNNEPSVQAMTRINADDLTFRVADDGLLETELDVLTAAFDISGRILGTLDHTYKAKVHPKNLDNIRKAGLFYSTIHPLKKAGAYQFRIVVRDAAGEAIGSASQFVETPYFQKKKRLGMSGLVMGRANELTASESSGPALSPLLRVFRAGERIYYWRQILNPKIDKASGAPDLVTRSRLYRDGELVQDNEPFPFRPTKKISDRLVEDIRLYNLASDLKPGRYILEVESIDRLRDAKSPPATEWLDFQIE